MNSDAFLFSGHPFRMQCWFVRSLRDDVWSLTPRPTIGLPMPRHRRASLRRPTLQVAVAVHLVAALLLGFRFLRCWARDIEWWLHPFPRRGALALGIRGGDVCSHQSAPVTLTIIATNPHLASRCSSRGRFAIYEPEVLRFVSMQIVILAIVGNACTAAMTRYVGWHVTVDWYGAVSCSASLVRLAAHAIRRRALVFTVFPTSVQVAQRDVPHSADCLPLSLVPAHRRERQFKQLASASFERRTPDTTPQHESNWIDGRHKIRH